MADRLDHQPIAPRREDIAPAAFEFGHRVALAAAAEDAVSEREHGLRGFDRQIAHQRLFGELADQLAALHEVRFSRPVQSLDPLRPVRKKMRSEEHTSELQSLMRISYAVFCLKKKNIKKNY